MKKISQSLATKLMMAKLHIFNHIICEDDFWRCIWNVFVFFVVLLRVRTINQMLILYQKSTILNLTNACCDLLPKLTMCFAFILSLFSTHIPSVYRVRCAQTTSVPASKLDVYKVLLFPLLKWKLALRKYFTWNWMEVRKAAVRARPTYW